MLLISRKKEPYKWPEERVGKCRHRQQYFDPYAISRANDGYERSHPKDQQSDNDDGTYPARKPAI